MKLVKNALHFPVVAPMGRKKRDWMEIQHEQEDGNSMRGRFPCPNWAAKAS